MPLFAAVFAMEQFLHPQVLAKPNGGESIPTNTNGGNITNGNSVNQNQDPTGTSGTASPDSTTVPQNNHQSSSLTTRHNSTANNNNNNSLKNFFSVNGAATINELAELASSEISLDLQGLIDDTHFGDVNLFGVDGDGGLGGGGGTANGGYGPSSMPNRTSPTNSLGSSGQSSPGRASNGGQDSPPSFVQQNYRSNNGGNNGALAYLPGSVHSGATFSQVPQQQVNNNHPSTNHQQQQQSTNNSINGNNIQVKQEPITTDDFHAAHRMRVAAAAVAGSNNNNHQRYSNGNHVSSTTNNSLANNSMATNAMTAMAAAAYAMNNGGVGPHQTNHHHQSPINSTSSPSTLPTLKSFATPPKYLQQNTQNPNGGLKKKVERNSDEYRKRRERNNVAVRKSREKAKVRSKETEERVKILARENERLQKKVELLQEELAVLRSLFSNVGVLPDHNHRELSRQMDSFQQQHNAMGC